MTRIRFETGQVVNFDGTPTQQDIDEVASKLGIGSQNANIPKKDGLVKTIAKEALGTLLVKPATRATEAISTIAFPKSEAAKGYELMRQQGESQDIGGISIPQQKPFGQGGGRQIASDVLKSATYLAPYGKIAQSAGTIARSPLAGKIIAGVAGGYASDVGYGLDKEQTVGEALKPGVGTVAGGLLPVAGEALKATGRLVSKAGQKAVDVSIPTSSREAKLIQTYKANKPFLSRVADVLRGEEKAPITASSTAVRTKAGQILPGLFGTKSQIGVQAKRASNSLWNDAISPALKKSDTTINIQDFFEKKAQDIIEKTPERTRQTALLKALNAIKDDYKGVGNISLEDLQKLKEGWAEFVPEKVYKGESVAGVINDVRNTLASEARDIIYNNLGPEIKQAYFDYGNLIGLQKMGQVAMTGSKLKGGAGSFISEIFSQAVTPIGTAGGQVLYRTGNGIEFLGKAGAKILGDVLGINSKALITNALNKMKE